MENKLQKVIDNGFCIGCGACTFIDRSIKVERNQYGMMQATYENVPKIEASEVCPFSSTEDETVMGARLYENISDISFEKRLGYYHGLYAGRVSNDQLRVNTSSGGVLTTLLLYLIENKLIDGVIHVKANDQEEDLFDYALSTTPDDILARAKSRYYHVSFSNMKDFLLSEKFSGNYVFVGIPCYIKSVRLLCEEMPRLKKNIKYFFGIFCGHMKTSAFGELFAWQKGIDPTELSAIDFRVKNTTGLSSQYSVSVQESDKTPILEKSYKLYGSDWGLGFFKPKACDWCDDVSGELADITFGDAWLPEYTSDSLGTNIIIVRDKILHEILLSQSQLGEITLETLSVEKIIESQAGNYRHRQEGLSVRLESALKKKDWTPKKRISVGDYDVSKKRKKLYLIREKLAEKSHFYFFEAKQKSNLIWFVFKMLPLEVQYHFYNNRFIKGTIKSLLNLYKFIFSRGNK